MANTTFHRVCSCLTLVLLLAGCGGSGGKSAATTSSSLSDALHSAGLTIEKVTLSTVAAFSDHVDPRLDTVPGVSMDSDELAAKKLVTVQYNDWWFFDDCNRGRDHVIIIVPRRSVEYEMRPPIIPAETRGSELALERQKHAGVPQRRNFY